MGWMLNGCGSSGLEMSEDGCKSLCTMQLRKLWMPGLKL